MNTKSRSVPILWFSATLMCVSPAIADFIGFDPLESKSRKWEQVASEGRARTVFQNSRLEYLVQQPAALDTSALGWVPNHGTTAQDWFIQVDVHLDKVALPLNSFTNLNLGVVGSNNRDQACFVSIDRYRDAGDGYVTSFESVLMMSPSTCKAML